MMILIITTLVVWMTQSLQRVEIMVEHGQGFVVFMVLSALIIPSLVGVIIPFALFGAVIYTLYRLHSDSEIAVIFAAGVSRWRIAAPIILITTVCAAATLYVSTDLMPRSDRVLKRHINEIRADIASAVIRSGEFTALSSDYTIYVERALPQGQFIGLLINDHRDPERPEVYMAERAVLQDTDAGPVLSLRNGNIQRIDPETSDVNIIRFEQTSVNISSLQENTTNLTREISERYPHELLNPNLENPWDKHFASKLIAEGHARYAAPLFTIAFAFVALYAMIGGSYSRQGYVLRACLAGAVVLFVKVMGFVTQNLAIETSMFWLVYASPAIAIFVALLLLSSDMLIVHRQVGKLAEAA